MKLKSLVLVGCLSLFSSAFADNHHAHSQTKSDAKSAVKKGLNMPGYCEIEVVNNSYEDVVVYGTYDDGEDLTPFTVRRYDWPHYINLFFNGYCHPSMYLHIENMYGKRVRGGTGMFYEGSTITLVPSLNNELKAEIGRK